MLYMYIMWCIYMTCTSHLCYILPSLPFLHLPVMIEGLAREVAEETLCEAVLFAHQEVATCESP